MSDAQRKRPLTGTERMRRSRARQKQGWRRVFVTIRDREVEGLVGVGLLDPMKQGSRAAIGNALGKLLDHIPPERWLALLDNSRPGW